MISLIQTPSDISLPRCQDGLEESISKNFHFSTLCNKVLSNGERYGDEGERIREGERGREEVSDCEGDFDGEGK